MERLAGWLEQHTMAIAEEIQTYFIHKMKGSDIKKKKLSFNHFRHKHPSECKECLSDNEVWNMQETLYLLKKKAHCRTSNQTPL